jgi:hypothetical protein
MVQHYRGATSGAKHTMDFSNGPWRIRRMVKYPMGIDKVKRIVSEGQVLSISLDETSLQFCQLKTPLRDTYGCIRQINRGVFGACAREVFSLAATTATDFEHSQAPGFFKAHGRLKTTMQFVPVFVEALKEGRGALRFIGKPRIARRPFPEVLDLFLDVRRNGVCLPAEGLEMNSSVG